MSKADFADAGLVGRAWRNEDLLNQASAGRSTGLQRPWGAERTLGWSLVFLTPLRSPYEIQYDNNEKYGAKNAAAEIHRNLRLQKGIA
jgi:hypothetical protein